MQTVLIRGAIEGAKMVASTAAALTAVWVGLHISSKIAPPLCDAVDAAIDGVTAATSQAASAARGVFAAKPASAKTETGVVVVETAAA